MAKRAVDYQQQTEEILAKLDIMAEYRSWGANFVGEPRSSGVVECFALGRDEKRASAAVNVETGVYIDKGGSGESLSFFDAAVKFGNLGLADWRAARKHFAAKAGVLIGNASPPDNPADLIQFLPWDAGHDRLVDMWCRSHKKGTSLEAVKFAGGMVGRYPLKTKSGEKCDPQYKVIALPAYGHHFTNAPPVSWVIYNISGQPFSLYRGKNSPPDIRKMLAICPNRGATMGPHAISRLLENSADIEWVVKTGGPSDMLAAITAIPLELREKVLVLTNASSETGDVLPHQVSLLAGRRVRVVHDADRAGEVGAVKWIAALAGKAMEVRHVRLPYAVKDKDGKDLRDFLRGVPAEIDVPGFSLA